MDRSTEEGGLRSGLAGCEAARATDWMLNAVMGQGAISVGPAFAVVLAALVAVAVLAALIGRLGVSRAVVTASARAVVQLTVVSLLITAVLRSWWATGGFIALMLIVAAGDLRPPGEHAAARLDGDRADRRRCAAGPGGHHRRPARCR